MDRPKRPPKKPSRKPTLIDLDDKAAMRRADEDPKVRWVGGTPDSGATLPVEDDDPEGEP